MKTIEEIMGLVEQACVNRAKAALGGALAYERIPQINIQIESALRELVERKPLEQKVALKMWAETGCIDHESGGIELIRNVERAHGIGA